MGHDNVLSGAWAGDNLVVVGGVETVVSGRRGDWMIIEEAGARVMVLCMGN